MCTERPTGKHQWQPHDYGRHRAAGWLPTEMALVCSLTQDGETGDVRLVASDVCLIFLHLLVIHILPNRWSSLIARGGSELVHLCRRSDSMFQLSQTCWMLTRLRACSHIQALASCHSWVPCSLGSRDGARRRVACTVWAAFPKIRNKSKYSF